jgi:hypothetical protein
MCLGSDGLRGLESGEKCRSNGCRRPGFCGLGKGGFETHRDYLVWEPISKPDDNRQLQKGAFFAGLLSDV